MASSIKYFSLDHSSVGKVKKMPTLGPSHCIVYAFTNTVQFDAVLIHIFLIMKLCCAYFFLSHNSTDALFNSVMFILFYFLTKLNWINPPHTPPTFLKIHVQTDRDPIAINTACRTCVRTRVCVRKIGSTCWFLEGAVSLHLLSLWSNLSEKREGVGWVTDCRWKNRRKGCRRGQKHEERRGKKRGQTFTSAVCQGEVVIVGDFRGETEGEVLSVIHLVFVQRTHCFDDLYRES